MTVEEMRAAGTLCDKSADLAPTKWAGGAFHLASNLFPMAAALCERLGAQNKLLERIAGALEGAYFNRAPYRGMAATEFAEED